ncbi:MAG: hypothetical protein ACRD10_03500 [Terriglobia bacterium]
MLAKIAVESVAEETFRITVTEGGGQSSHVVTLKPEYHRKLTAGKISAEELVRRSFEFLLEREPKDSILANFDLPVIGRYFPEYETEMRKRSGAL